MSWITIDILCTVCDHKWDELVKRPAPETGSGDFTCPECQSPAHRCPSGISNLRASHQMGYKRGPAWADMKEAAKLKTARADLPHDKRGDINKEIAAREKSAGKSYVKKEKGE